MKKIYVWLFVTAGIILSANAQPFEKGDKLIGGTISAFNNDSPGANNSTTFLSISPLIGFFTKPNRLTGFSLFFSSNLNQQHTYGASVYKQYWNSLGKNFYFIMQGEISLSYNSTHSPYINQINVVDRHEKLYTLAVNINPGFAYRINRRLVVDAFLANFFSISDSYLKQKDLLNNGSTYTFHDNTIRFNSSLNGFTLSNIQLGFRYVL